MAFPDVQFGLVGQMNARSVGVPLALVPGTPQPTDLMSSYQPRLPLINQAMGRMPVSDLIGSIQDIVGFWLVDTLGLTSPEHLTSRFRMGPEDPAFDYLDSFILKQIALWVLHSAARAPLEGDLGSSHESAFSSLEKNALRVVGPDASDEVRERVLRYLEERGLGEVKVVQLLRTQGLHTIPSRVHPTCTQYPTAACMPCQ